MNLMLGNYMMDRDGRICVVEKLCIEEGPTIRAIEGAITKHPVKPIKLCHGWIRRCGFSFHDDHYLLDAGDRVFQVNNIECIPHLWMKDVFSTIEKEYVFLCNPLYVDQLQNAIQMLTGKPLKIEI